MNEFYCYSENPFLTKAVLAKNVLCDDKTIKIRIADPLGIKKAIFNPPATIVYWEDGEKTVVRCDKDDTYNREMGIALCIVKKALKNSSRKLNDALALAEEKKEGE